MISQRFKIVSPESPRMAEVELLRSGWSVFLTWKHKSPLKHGERPAFLSSIKDKAEAEKIANAWVDRAESPAPRRVTA